MTGFAARVEAIVRALRPGEVVSYGQLAARAGRPGAARAAGTVLARSSGLPWWRVVHVDGTFAAGKEARQAALLTAEGVAVRRRRLAARPAWDPLESGSQLEP